MQSKLKAWHYVWQLSDLLYLQGNVLQAEGSTSEGEAIQSQRSGLSDAAEKGAPASPSVSDLPNSGGKRGRTFPSSNKGSSLLAVKLRGVDICRSPRPTYRTLYPNRSKA